MSDPFDKSKKGKDIIWRQGLFNEAESQNAFRFISDDDFSDQGIDKQQLMTRSTETGAISNNAQDLSNCDPFLTALIPTLASKLSADETLLWLGRPDDGLLGKKCIVEFLLFVGLASYCLFRTIAWAIIFKFLSYGVVIIALVLFINRYRKIGSTIYAITNRRVVFFRKDVTGFPYMDLPLGKIYDVNIPRFSFGTINLYKGFSFWNRWGRRQELVGISNSKDVASLIKSNLDAGVLENYWKKRGWILVATSLLLIPSLYLRTVDRFVHQPSWEVYVPKGLQPGKRCPLIVGLTPDGVGKNEIAVLKQACDRYKSIAIGSNDCKNELDYDQWEPKVVAAINQACKLYPIDPEKIYVSGFSGGGMAAYYFAEDHPEIVKGLIINTGMMPYASDPPKDEPLPNDFPKAKHAVFLASPTDFRYKAMKKNRELLKKKLGWKVDWIEFQGGQKYAPSEKYVEAVRLVETE